MSNIFTSSWDETKPDGDRDIPLGDDDIREFKQQVRERLEIDHHALASEGTDPNILYTLEQKIKEFSICNLFFFIIFSDK